MMDEPGSGANIKDATPPNRGLIPHLPSSSSSSSSSIMPPVRSYLPAPISLALTTPHKLSPVSFSLARLPTGWWSVALRLYGSMALLVSPTLRHISHVFLQLIVIPSPATSPPGALALGSPQTLAKF
ncbi:unnamed protein product [Protopolystoma xenopodis]|uniref:Uncharacterized protein n=1 Tax=Protopolystoma xenopodis TaxID=117903 RepID=A0A448WG06_9PLAT|nr:unnamed protein product [Protopolystoma xenopodis]